MLWFVCFPLPSTHFSFFYFLNRLYGHIVKASKSIKRNIVKRFLPLFPVCLGPISVNNNPLYYLVFQGIFQTERNLNFSLFPFLMDNTQMFPFSFSLLHNSLLYGQMYHDLLTSILLMGIYVASHPSLLTNSSAMSSIVHTSVHKCKFLEMLLLSRRV